MTCEHLNFTAECRIDRLKDGPGERIKGFNIDVRVKCSNCGIKFRFMGLPFGSSPKEPCVSADGTELRAPIEPNYVPEILGMPVTSGNA